jgi:hypothetical protein
MWDWAANPYFAIMAIPPTSRWQQFMKTLILAALAASFLAMGCAAPEKVTTGERAEEAEMMTGSRIPRRTTPQPVKVVGPREIEINNTVGTAPKGN